MPHSHGPYECFRRFPATRTEVGKTESEVCPCRRGRNGILRRADAAFQIYALPEVYDTIREQFLSKENREDYASLGVSVNGKDNFLAGASWMISMIRVIASVNQLPSEKNGSATAVKPSPRRLAQLSAEVLARRHR